MAVTVVGSAYSARSSGVTTESCSDVGGGTNLSELSSGQWTRHDSVAMDAGYTLAYVRASNGAGAGSMQIRTGSTSGPIIASVTVWPTGGWQSWRTFVVPLSSSLSGSTDLYFTYGGNLNLNWIRFDAPPSPDSPRQFVAEFWDFYGGSVAVEPCSDPGTARNLSDFGATGDYVGWRAPGIAASAREVAIRVASNSVANGTLTLRLGSTSGTAVASWTVASTGGWQTWRTLYATRSVTGDLTDDLYLVASGSALDFVNVAWVKFGPALVPLAGTGALSVAGSVSGGGSTVEASASLSGTGSLTSDASVTRLAAVALSGSGSLASSGVTVRLGAVALSGSGSLSADATVGKPPGTVSLSGTGSLTADGLTTRVAAAALSGTGTLSAGSAADRYTSGSLSGTGLLTSAALAVRLGVAALSGTGSLSGDGVTVRLGTTSLSGAGSLSVAGSVSGAGADVAVAGTGSLSAGSYADRYTSVSLSGSGSLVASGQTRDPVTATVLLSGTGLLSAGVNPPGVWVTVQGETVDAAGIGASANSAELVGTTSASRIGL